MLIENLFLQSLSPRLLETIGPHARPFNFAVGNILFTPGKPIDRLYFVEAGAVSLVLELANGQMIESAMVGQEGVVGGYAALSEQDVFYKAIVQVAVRCRTLNIHVARQIAHESEEFRTAIVRHEQAITAQAQQSAACNAAHNLHQRLARWLLRARDATGRDNFQITQEVMAEMLGVGRTSVSLTAHQMQERGLIRYRRGNVSIDDLAGLKETACECHDRISTLYKRLEPVANRMRV
jgi:CRP-like cAMP-binding protein